MFRTFARIFLPNRLDFLSKRAKRRSQKRILLAWNRGLGDIALGLYAVVHRIRFWIPDAEITFLIRENLREGFSLLENVRTIVAPDWVRGEKVDVVKTLLSLGRHPSEFDLIIPAASPTDWVRWQLGHLVPRLKWKAEYDELCQTFDLPDSLTYVGVQVQAETNYGLWRNWPEERWRELFDRLLVDDKMRVILFGYGAEPSFSHERLIDLRGKTSLLQLLSIIKNKCRFLIVPDSGILSMAYYLDVAFPLKILSLWADPRHGILKQNVASPNPLLVHRPLIGEHRDLSTILAEDVLKHVHNYARPN